jgi:hypothetical protein
LSAVPANESAESKATAPGASEMKDLQAFVGGFDALMHLDTEPLPREDFDWSSVETRDGSFVAWVLTLVSRCCDELLDDQYRTIAWRILARVASRDPRVLRRSDNAERLAAGLVWLAGRGSGAFARQGFHPRSAELWRWFGVTDCAERGRGLRAAAGLSPDADLEDYVDSHPCSDAIALGDAALLHSRYRESLIMQRDARIKYAAASARRDSPVVSLEGNDLIIASEPIAVFGAAKSLPVDGERLGICIVLGTELDRATCYHVSIPDARKLVQCVQSALADPPPRRKP